MTRIKRKNKKIRSRFFLNADSDHNCCVECGILTQKHVKSRRKIVGWKLDYYKAKKIDVTKHYWICVSCRKALDKAKKDDTIFKSLSEINRSLLYTNLEPTSFYSNMDAKEFPLRLGISKSQFYELYELIESSACENSSFKTISLEDALGLYLEKLYSGQNTSELANSVKFCSYFQGKNIIKEVRKMLIKCFVPFNLGNTFKFYKKLKYYY